MNLYFLLEGKRTEKKVYPKWLSVLIPSLTEIQDPFLVTANNYYLFTGNGFPALLDNHLRNSIADVNNIAKFDFLIICLDSDEETVDARREDVLDFMSENQLELSGCQLVVIVQNKCIESWFLGNKKAYSNQPQSVELRRYSEFYNVKIDDPERMTMLPDFGTCAQFHEAYLSEMLREKNVRYTKKNPGTVMEKHYLDSLISRQSGTNHLQSFKYFVDFCKKVQDGIATDSSEMS